MLQYFTFILKLPCFQRYLITQRPVVILDVSLNRREATWALLHREAILGDLPQWLRSRDFHTDPRPWARWSPWCPRDSVGCMAGVLPLRRIWSHEPWRLAGFLGRLAKAPVPPRASLSLAGSPGCARKRQLSPGLLPRCALPLRLNCLFPPWGVFFPE